MTGKVLVDITDFSVPETQLPDSDDELLYELDEALDLNVSETEEHFPEHQETEDNDEEPEDNDKEKFSEVMLLKGSSFHNNFQHAYYIHANN